MIRCGADDYYRAARDRLEDTRYLIAEERFCLAMYASGVAVECAFRALGRLKQDVFGGSHDLYRMMTRVADLGFYCKGHEDDLVRHVNTLRTVWNNGLRYADAELVARYLKGKELDRGVQGDTVKFYSKRLYSAALAVVGRLEAIWRRHRHSKKPLKST